MMKVSPKLAVLGVFLAGIVLGAVGHKACFVFGHHGFGPPGFGFHHHRPPPPDPRMFRERLLEDLTDELELSREQRTKAEPVLKEMHHQLIQIRVQNQDRVEAVVRGAIEKAGAFLSPEQRKKLEELYSRVQEHWRAENRDD